MTGTHTFINAFLKYLNKCFHNKSSVESLLAIEHNYISAMWPTGLDFGLHPSNCKTRMHMLYAHKKATARMEGSRSSME